MRRVAALGAATAAVGRERIGVGVTTGSGVVTLAPGRGRPRTAFSVRQVPVQIEGYNEGSERAQIQSRFFFDFFGVNKPCIMNQLHPNGGDRPRRGDL